MLTAVASNNGINISTGSREPPRQKGPPDPALEDFRSSFRRLHTVCLLGSYLGIFFLMSYKIRQGVILTNNISWLNTDKEIDQSFKVPNDDAF